MANYQEQFVAYGKLIDAKEEELLEKQNEVLEFVDTEHRINATKKYLKALRHTEIEINEITLGSSFKRATKAALKSPSAVKNSFALFYVKESSKDIGKRMVKRLKSEKSFMIA